MRKIQSLLNEYGESHQNPFNKKVHWICVPVIFWSIVALLWAVKFPPIMHISLNLAMVVLFLVWLYYVRLSVNLSFGLLLFAVFCAGLCYCIEQAISTSGLVYTALTVFILAWIGQFYGHKVEGKKPSFLKDVQFLLIGPAWLMHFIYNRLGVKW